MTEKKPEFDRDIEAMNLSYGEKSGLQMYRNYTRAFDDYAEKLFAAQVDNESLELGELERVVAILVKEDPRFLPMIACAYADDELKEMFKREVPDGAPGGKSNLLGRMGPFSDLAKRLQLAYVFRMVTPDLALEFEKLRVARNRLAHTWDISALNEFFVTGPMDTLRGAVEVLHERADWFPGGVGDLSKLQIFRLNLIWLVVRIAYEARYWPRARATRLRPESALFGKNHPKRLGDISRVALAASREIVGISLPKPPSATE